MKDKKRENEKIRYNVFSVRLHEGTKKSLIEQRKKTGLSWNRFLLSLITKK
jgi:hypothetical protein